VKLRRLQYQVPTQAFLFEKLDTAAGVLHYTLQSPASSDEWAQYYPYTVPWQVDDRNMAMITAVHQAFVNSKLPPSQEIFINSGALAMQYKKASRIYSGISFFGIWFIPLALGFLLPVFVFTIVVEKQERLIEMMKIMGLSMTSYWVITYLLFLILSLCVVAIITATGAAFLVPFFRVVNPFIYLLLFVLWANAQIALGFFFSTLFNKQRTATIVCYFIVFVQIVGAINLNVWWLKSSRAPVWYMLYPPFAFVRGVYLISASMFEPTQNVITLASMAAGQQHSEMTAVYLYLILDTAIWLLLALYLDRVLPREYGVT